MIFDSVYLCHTYSRCCIHKSIVVDVRSVVIFFSIAQFINVPYAHVITRYEKSTLNQYYIYDTVERADVTMHAAFSRAWIFDMAWGGSTKITKMIHKDILNSLVRLGVIPRWCKNVFWNCWYSAYWFYGKGNGAYGSFMRFMSAKPMVGYQW